MGSNSSGVGGRLVTKTDVVFILHVVSLKCSREQVGQQIQLTVSTFELSSGHLKRKQDFPTS